MSPFYWSAVAFAIFLLAGERWRLARRRNAMNRALHEIRRPLQALALLSPGAPVPGGPATAGGIAGPPGFGTNRPDSRPLETPGFNTSSRVSFTEPVLQAIDAVGDLDRELNGGAPAGRRSEMVAARLMADGCVRRWQSRASLSGARIDLLWSGPDVLVRGDGVALAAALENLIVNAIEHGGPQIQVTGKAIGNRVRIEVKDSGTDARPDDCVLSPAETINRLTGRGRNGHGLTIVEEVAGRHGGRLDTAFDQAGSSAVLTLPKASRAAGSASAVRVNW